MDKEREKFITSSEILFHNMRCEYNTLKDKFPFLTSYEIATSVLNNVELFAFSSVQAEYSAKKLFMFWLSRNM